MIGALLSLIPTLAGILGSNKAHNQYSEDLDKIGKSLKVPDAAYVAEQEYAADKTFGYRNLSSMEERVKSTLPETIGAYKDALTGNMGIDLVTKAAQQTNQNLQELYDKDNALKQQHSDIYKAFMGSTMAGYQNKLQDDKAQLAIAKGYNDVDKAAVTTKTLGGMGNMLAGIADKDIASLIAGLSKDPGKLDLSTGQNYKIKAGPTETEPAVDKGTKMFTGPYDLSPITLNNSDKSLLSKLNLNDPDLYDPNNPRAKPSLQQLLMSIMLGAAKNSEIPNAGQYSKFINAR